MKRALINDLHLWQFEGLGNEGSIKHFVTDRNTVNTGKGFTLSYSSSPDKNEVKEILKKNQLKDWVNFEKHLSINL